MNCRDFESAVKAGELLFGGGPGRDLAAHASGCAACHSLLDEERRLVELVDLGLTDLPKDVVGRAGARLLASFRCSKSREEIAAYVDGALGSAQRRAFEQHEGRCARCHSEMLALRALATTLEHGLPGLERSPAAERACVEAVLGAPTPMELPAAPLRFWTPNGFALRAAAAMLLAALFGLAFASRSSEPEIANERSRSVDRGRGFERGSAPARVELKGEPTLLRPTPAAPTPQAVRVAPEPVAVPSAPVAAPALTPRPVTPEPVGRPVELAREPAPVERRVEPSREAPEQERMVALAMRMGLKASDVEVVRHRALLEGIDRLREAEVVRSMDLLTVLDLEDFE